MTAVAIVLAILLELSCDVLAAGNFSLLGPLGIFGQACLGPSVTFVSLLAAAAARSILHLSRNQPRVALGAAGDGLWAVLAVFSVGQLGWMWGTPFALVFLFVVPLAAGGRLGLDTGGRAERAVALAAVLCLVYPALSLSRQAPLALICLAPVCCCLAAVAHARPELRRTRHKQRSAERDFSRQRSRLEQRAEAAVQETRVQVHLRHHVATHLSKMRLLLDGTAELSALNSAPAILQAAALRAQSWTGRRCGAEFGGQASGPLPQGWHQGVLHVEGDAPPAEELELLTFWDYLVQAALQRCAEQSSWIQASKLAAVGQLAAGIAHELNTPLGALMVSAEIAKSCVESNPDRALSRLELVDQASQQMKGIIEQLLRYARVSGGNQERLELSQLAQASRTLVDHSYQIAGITLQSQFQAVYAQVNPVEIQQVIVNLLVNAMQSARSWVGMRTVAAGGRAFVLVEDDGGGVPAEIVERIFDPFFTTKEVGKGVGLGLWVATQVAESHAGTLRYETREEGGARFILELPALA